MSAKQKIIPIFIPHLGCPHACVFCNQREITGTSAENAYTKLKQLCEAAEKPGSGLSEATLAFYGGSFTAIPVEQQIRYLETAKDRFAAIRVSTRPDAVDLETMDRLKSYGVKIVELGAQSMVDTVLEASGRGHNAQDVRRASKIIQQAGCTLVLQMMTGLPGDTEEGALHTAKEIITLQPDAVRIYPTVIVRGTQLERMWENGTYREHTVEEAVELCAKLLPHFQEAGIPVIRLGLNPTEELSGGAAVAGAYHPALGELVYSRVMRNRLEALLRENNVSGKTVTILVPAALLSQAIGQRQENIRWLTERFHLLSLSIRPHEQQQIFCEAV